jgi:hypothetical protein
MPVRLSLIVLLALAVVVCAAPAPFEKRNQSADEVTFDAGTEERAMLARLYLHSYALANALMEDEKGKRLLGSLNEAERFAWLKSRIQVTVEGSLVRVRVDGSRIVLQIVTDRLTGRTSKTVSGDDSPQIRRKIYAQRLLAMKALQGRGRGVVSDDDVAAAEQAAAAYEFEAEPLKLYGSPRR